MQFQVSFVDHGGRVYSNSALEASCEGDAVDLARRTYHDNVDAGYLIWKDEALVHCEWLSVRPPYLVVGKQARAVFAA